MYFGLCMVHFYHALCTIQLVMVRCHSVMHHTPWHNVLPINVLHLQVFYFHPAQCTMQVCIVHFHYVIFALVRALPPCIMNNATWNDALSQCTLHFGMVHFNHPPCSLHLSTKHIHYAMFELGRRGSTIHYRPCTMVCCTSIMHSAS